MTLKEILKKNLNVPNVLSLIRLLLVPVYLILFVRGQKTAALVVFAAACFTDLLDGRIARKYNLITDLGKLLDPVADKVMILTAMFSMTIGNDAIPAVIPWAAVLVVLAKELLMIAGGALLLKHGIVVYSSMVAWIPMFLVREMGWTSAEVGAYMSPVYLFTGIVITPLSGIISDRLGRWSRKTRAWLGVPCFVLLAACFGFGFMLKSFPLIALGVMLFLIPVTGIHIATQELVPARYKASAYGTYVTFLQGLGFFGPMLVGALSDAFGLNIAIVYVQFVFVLGALMLLCAGFTYQGDFDRARALDKR